MISQNTSLLKINKTIDLFNKNYKGFSENITIGEGFRVKPENVVIFTFADF